MRKLIILIFLFSMIILPVSATELEPPVPPDSADEYMPHNTESFSEGLWFVLKTAIHNLQPSIAEASGVCLSVIAAVMLCSLLQGFSGNSKQVTVLAGVVTVGVLLFRPTNSLMQLGIDTVGELTDYGKMLIPVLTGAMAMQGGVTSSAALYSGTVLFSGLLSTAIYKLVVPLVYVYMCLTVANNALGQDKLAELQKFSKWLIVWIIKIVLYVFTGYMSITGVISGSVDAATLKATKLTVSGVVPVVGNIVADASETILVSARMVKNSIGVYGMLAVISILAGPFIKIGTQYLLVKLTAAVCSVFGHKQVTGLMKEFSGAMGIVLAMVGVVGLLLMVSIVCFMKGLG